MEHNKQICCGSEWDRLPPLSTNYPWFVAQNLESTQHETEVQIFYNVHEPLTHYRCLIPELLGRRIWGYFNGWVILSDYPHNVAWSLWNPVTSNFIRLPTLHLKDNRDSYNDIEYCCLSSPPEDPNSVLLLTRRNRSTFVICRRGCNGKGLRWTEKSYAKQLKRMTGVNDILHSLTSCNGKVYAFTIRYYHVVQVSIAVNGGGKVEISFLPILELPSPPFNGCSSMIPYLKGSSTELFTILIGFESDKRETVRAVYLFKLDWTTMMWEEMVDLKEHIFSLDLESDDSVSYRSPSITSGSGGYIHILGKKGKIIYSYNVKDKTISLSSMPFLIRTSHVSAWAMSEYRSEAGNQDSKDSQILVRSSVVKGDDDYYSTIEESHLLSIPSDVLNKIMEFCVGVEYLKFRATCKQCLLAAPLTQWNNKNMSTKLNTSPWLMVFDKHQGIITFTDPTFGDKYFIKTPPLLICDFRMYYSKCGWWLLFIDEGPLVFFNPFTRDIRQLPPVPYLDSFGFSAPPTSPDCMVIGFTTCALSPWHVYIHFVSRESSWRKFTLNFGGLYPYSFSFPTFHGRDLYALCNDGEVDIFKENGKDNFSWEVAVNKSPISNCSGSSGQYNNYLVKGDQGLLLVVVSKFGESIQVFKSNDPEKKWEILQGLGTHAIYICERTCLYIEAKTSKMANKIYFPRLHSKNGNIVFYSLETCRYHTFDGDDIQKDFGDFSGTKHHLSPHAWIEPSWSYIDKLFL